MKKKIISLSELLVEFPGERLRSELTKTKAAYKILLDELFRKNTDEIVNNTDNKSKAMWSLINNEKNKCGKSFSNIELYQANSPHQTCQMFNDYFINIPKQVSQQITCNDNNAPAIDKHVTNTIFLTPTDSSEVELLIKQMKNKKSTGPDEMSNVLVKLSCTALSKPLVHIINLAFSSGKFPSSLKLTKVVPVYKKGNLQDPSNYRPIALLSPFSKIFEKIIVNRIVQFIKKEKLLSDHQYGFRQGRSTINALVNATDEIYQNCENKRLTVGSFLDLTKAFDCVDINLVISKLNNYGIRGRAGEFLTSYLTNRQQYVQLQNMNNNIVETYKSDYQVVTAGVPQGSVLGPLLYLIYVNSIIKKPDPNNKMVMFADDTSILLSSSSLQQTLEQTNIELNQLAQHFAQHKLLVNHTKTNYIIFKTQQHNINNNTCIHIDNNIIQSTNHTKFLGLVIDNHLSWNNHVSYLSKKISSALFLLRRMSQIGSEDISLTVYYSMIQSIIAYGINVWGVTSETNIQQIFRLQKKAIRYIKKLNYRDSCRTAFVELKILTVPSLIIYHTLVFNFSSLNSLPHLGDSHSHNTRNRSLLAFPQHSTQSFEKLSLYRTIKLYNKLPVNVQIFSQNKSKFKTMLKEYLVTKCFYSLKEYLDE